MPSIGLLVRTLSRYEPHQLWNYALRRMVRARPDLRPAPPLRARTGPVVPGIARPFTEDGHGTFRLLNVEHRIATAADWNAPHIPMLWRYTLHYHEWLSADASHGADQRRLTARWMAENPPAGGTGWDPYPISLRTVQWIKWLARGDAPVDGMLDSLAAQIRHLSRTLETHLGANHLFANAVALTAAGLYFDGAEADGWLSIGLTILTREIPKQYHRDGGHYELSPSYHALLLESLLDLENLARAYGMTRAKPWAEVLPRAIAWMQVMMRPDGTFPQFNDCAQGVAPTSAEVEAYAAAIGVAPGPLPSSPLFDLPDTGYARLRNGGLDVFVDAGPFAPRTQPGHGHCDMLSFELSAGGLLLIVNSGTSTYERSARRMTERATAAHNTVQVDGAEQSEIWSAFRAGRTAKIVDRIARPDGLAASHDGYRPLGITHRRSFTLKDGRLTITDTMQGPPRDCVARLHFAPGIVPQGSDDTYSAGPLRITLKGAKSSRIADYEQAQEFNRRLPAKVLEIGFTGELQTDISPS